MRRQLPERQVRRRMRVGHHGVQRHEGRRRVRRRDSPHRGGVRRQGQRLRRRGRQRLRPPERRAQLRPVQPAVQDRHELPGRHLRLQVLAEPARPRQRPVERVRVHLPCLPHPAGSVRRHRPELRWYRRQRRHRRRQGLHGQLPHAGPLRRGRQLRGLQDLHRHGGLLRRLLGERRDGVPVRRHLVHVLHRAHPGALQQPGRQLRRPDRRGVRPEERPGELRRVRHRLHEAELARRQLLERRLQLGHRVPAGLQGPERPGRGRLRVQVPDLPARRGVVQRRGRQLRRHHRQLAVGLRPVVHRGLPCGRPLHRGR